MVNGIIACLTRCRKDVGFLGLRTLGLLLGGRDRLPRRTGFFFAAFGFIKPSAYTVRGFGERRNETRGRAEDHVWHEHENTGVLLVVYWGVL